MYLATTFTSAAGKGESLFLRTRLSLADYRAMLRQQREKSRSAAPISQSSMEADVEKTVTEASGKKVQTISVTQPRTSALVNPAMTKKTAEPVVAQEVDDQNGQPGLQIPVEKINFIINGKQSQASKLKQFLANGESNLFKITGNTIDVVPAKKFSGKTAPIKLSVTTVNGDQHIVNYVTSILKPAIVRSRDDQKKEQVVFMAGKDQYSLKNAGVRQVFFTKDGNNTTVVNVTANGQTVAEAEIEPETGVINLVQLAKYSGQLDEVPVAIYLQDNQVITYQYQPKFLN